jgi:hypothetical protein
VRGAVHYAHTVDSNEIIGSFAALLIAFSSSSIADRSRRARALWSATILLFPCTVWDWKKKPLQVTGVGASLELARNRVFAGKSSSLGTLRKINIKCSFVLKLGNGAPLKWDCFDLTHYQIHCTVSFCWELFDLVCDCFGFNSIWNCQAQNESVLTTFAWQIPLKLL